ncbi:hypothetical protein ACTA71_009266 [Dictyostelium dimigraforme]
MPFFQRFTFKQIDWKLGYCNIARSKSCKSTSCTTTDLCKIQIYSVDGSYCEIDPIYLYDEATTGEKIKQDTLRLCHYRISGTQGIRISYKYRCKSIQLDFKFVDSSFNYSCGYTTRSIEPNAIPTFKVIKIIDQKATLHFPICPSTIGN